MKKNYQKLDINFFARCRAHEKEKKSRRLGGILGVALVVLAASAGVGSYAYVLVRQNQELDANVQSLRDYVEDAGNVAAFADATSLKTNIGGLLAYNAACERYIGALKEQPRVDSGYFDTVRRLLPQNVRIVAYEYEEPVLTVECETEDKDAPALFAKHLTGEGEFAGVAYDGFATLSAEEGTYSFSIQCKLW